MPAKQQERPANGSHPLVAHALALTGRPVRLWVRPLWLNPDFWETPSPSTRQLPLAAAPNGGTPTGPPAHEQGADRPSLTVSIEDHRGKPLLQARGLGQARGSAAGDSGRFRLQEGQLHWEGSTVRLPPDLDLVLEPKSADQATLTLLHASLGPVCTFQSVMFSQDDGRGIEA